MQHILQNQQEYGTMDNIIYLLKPLNNAAMLIPYEQLFIQSLHQERKLIAEQYPGEQNPLFQPVTEPSYTSHDATVRSTSPRPNTLPVSPHPCHQQTASSRMYSFEYGISPFLTHCILIYSHFNFQNLY